MSKNTLQRSKFIILFLFFRDLINNIAEKYDLERTQIAVSSVEDNGMTSFQVMPFFIESVDDFQKKMDQIDIDVKLLIFIFCSFVFIVQFHFLVQHSRISFRSPIGCA